MSTDHSVAKHLEVSPAAYDEQIRRFVPSYEKALDEALGALEELLPDDDVTVLDLGAGTGALAALVAARLPRAKVILLDADAAMLDRARERLEAVKDRATFQHGSFAGELPRCDAAAASLSLHHIRERSEKVAAYQNVRAAVTPGGVFVSIDAMVPRALAFAQPLRRRWAAHLVQNGDTEAEAFARFAQWARLPEGDRYFGIDEELAMMKEAGFVDLDVRFRKGPIAVVVALVP